MYINIINIIIVALQYVSKHISITIKYLKQSRRFSPIRLLKFKIITLITNSPANNLYHFYMLYSQTIKILIIINIAILINLLSYFTSIKISFDLEGFNALIATVISIFSIDYNSIIISIFSIDYNSIIISFKNVILDFINKYLYNIQDYSIEVRDTNIEDLKDGSPLDSPLDSPFPDRGSNPATATLPPGRDTAVTGTEGEAVAWEGEAVAGEGATQGSVPSNSPAAQHPEYTSQGESKGGVGVQGGGPGETGKNIYIAGYIILAIVICGYLYYDITNHSIVYSNIHDLLDFFIGNNDQPPVHSDISSPSPSPAPSPNSSSSSSSSSSNGSDATINPRRLTRYFSPELADASPLHSNTATAATQQVMDCGAGESDTSSNTSSPGVSSRKRWQWQQPSYRTASTQTSAIEQYISMAKPWKDDEGPIPTIEELEILLNEIFQDDE